MGNVNSLQHSGLHLYLDKRSRMAPELMKTGWIGKTSRDLQVKGSFLKH